jgi:hypothetical protein
MKSIDISFIKAYLVPILVLIIIIALVPLVLVPRTAILREKNLQVQTKRDRLAILNQKIDDLEQIDDSSESLKLIEVEKAIPSRKELAPLIVGIGNLANKNNLQLAGLNFKPGKVATESSNLAQVPENSAIPAGQNTKSSAKDNVAFTATLTGSLESLRQFLVDLEGAKQLLGVSSIKSKHQEDGSYKFELQANAPFKSIQQEGDIISKPVPPFSAALNETFKLISKFVNYTTVTVPKVPTGVEDPFK